MVRPRLIGGVIVVLAVALAGIFSGLFPGMGGLGEGDGSDGAARVSVDGEDAVATPDVEPDSEDEAPEADAGPSDVVMVLIDGRSYRLQQSGQEPGAEIDLPALIQKVRQAPGNSEGIKLSVSRSKASLPSAEKALEDALKNAGIEEESVERKEGLVASPGS